MIGDLNGENALFGLAAACPAAITVFECDNCYGICPDNAILQARTGNRFAFKYDYCKGLRHVRYRMPCGAIEVVPEI